MNPLPVDDRRRATQRQLGLVWGSVALILVAFSPFATRILSVLPACPVKTFLGVPCPSCGAARSATALAELDLPLALATNPLLAIGWMVLVSGGVWAGTRAVFGSGVSEPSWRLSIGWRLAAIGVVTLNWVYLIWAGV
ncbi:MAG: DUF2752 domain-containing protein [Acidobacteriota bacterium]